MSYDADKFEYGDRVVVIKTLPADRAIGIKLGHVAKIINVGIDCVYCINPEWKTSQMTGRKKRIMLLNQIQKIT